MKRMLYAGESAMLHLEKADRHVRLCVRSGDNLGLVTLMEPKIAALQESHARRIQARRERMYAHDVVVYNDGVLDDSIRDAYDKCVIFDRGNGASAPVLQSVFPDGTYGEIVRKSLETEPDAAIDVAIRLESLGSDSALYPLAAELREKAGECKKAQADFAVARRKEQDLRAAEEVVKNEMRQQYESNYLQARDKLGRKKAGRLFPGSSPRKNGNENGAETAEAKAA
jgi:hypothetical protein